MKLLDCINDRTLSLRDRHSIDVIYFDFAKAFDTVSRTLRPYGFLCDTLLDVLCVTC